MYTSNYRFSTGLSGGYSLPKSTICELVDVIADVQNIQKISEGIGGGLVTSSIVIFAGSGANESLE
jgi:hypothetical protein